jgi:aspartate/methionine/tyrosine aminotransferase
MFSRRTGWDQKANAFADRLAAALESGEPLCDLTQSNPTRAGLGWPEDRLLAAFQKPGLSSYRPDPRGDLAARRAVADYLLARGCPTSEERILLTASTSEAYALLLKLLCDPGDEVLVPAPSYPLLDLVAGLESVGLRRYPLRYDGSWHLDVWALEAAIGPRTRALVVVSPHNPTGAVLAEEDYVRLDEVCAKRDLALVSDEVFADSAPSRVAGVLGPRLGLAFHLSGLSKVCGLPQLKVAWLAAAGKSERVDPALERLATIADTYLSVAGPSQAALLELLPAREAFQGPLRRRLGQNRATLFALKEGGSFTALRSGGGWVAVLRVGETLDEEELCLSLLEEDRVAVQPGFFYDFERPGYLVVSLLAPPEAFTEGLRRLARGLERWGQKGHSGRFEKPE